MAPHPPSCRRLRCLAASLAPKAAAKTAAQPPPGSDPTLIAVEKLWPPAADDGPAGQQHMFTDLIRYKGAFFCVFRQAADHMSEDGVLLVVRSETGDAPWQLVSTLTCPPPNRDLRDPKLSITPDNELMLTAGAYRPQKQCRTYVWHSQDPSLGWSEPTGPVAPAGEWGWRTFWDRDDQAYLFTRSEAQREERVYGSAEDTYAQLYRSVDGGRRFAAHGPRQFEGIYANEYDAVFLEDGTCKVLIRKDSHDTRAELGTSRPPYTDWSWQKSNLRIGGPALTQLPDGRLVACCRLFNEPSTDIRRTALCWLDPTTAELTEFLTFPSGGDTSYAGMVVHEGVLFVSYYSSHESATAVYLAKVKL